MSSGFNGENEFLKSILRNLLNLGANNEFEPKFMRLTFSDLINNFKVCYNQGVHNSSYTKYTKIFQLLKRLFVRYTAFEEDKIVEKDFRTKLMQVKIYRKEKKNLKSIYRIFWV